jgi:hypothetical protein
MVVPSVSVPYIRERDTPVAGLTDVSGGSRMAAGSRRLPDP